MAGPRRRPVKTEPVLTLGSSRYPAPLRLLSAERPEEIFPILLEEIINLGFAKVLLLEVDFETGDIKPTASLNYPKAQLEAFRTSLWAKENPIVSALEMQEPTTLPQHSASGGSLYAYPMIYRSPIRCWEAERERRQDCLALQNFQNAGRLPFEKQVCAVCGMRAYATIVVTQMSRTTGESQLRQFRTLVERANGNLARLYKFHHYIQRMEEMESTISGLNAVMQSMADPVILTDNQHRVVVQNKAAEHFFRVPEGVTEGGKRAVAMNNLLFSAALSSMVVSATNTSRDLTLVDVMEGEEVLFEAVCAPTHSPDGVHKGTVTVMRDVTDLRKADEEVRANLEKLLAAEEIVRQDRDRLNLVIENVGDPIIVADNSAKIVLFDPLAKELFGDGESARRRPENVKNQAKLDADLTSFTFSFVDKESKSLRLYNPTTRAEIEYAARSGKIYDSRGQVAYTVTVLRDFSTWKKLELLQTERQMLETERFAATGRLAGTIAHEINNPLEAIKNSIHLLEGKIGASSEPVYNILKNETERLTRIVRQMLGLYRNTNQLAKFDLNAIVEDTLTLFGRPLAKGGVTVEKRLKDIPLIRGSGDQFRQLLSNLVVNARDSMPSGGRLIIETREVRSHDGLHSRVRLTVADTGSGIPRGMRKLMFEPFVSTKGEKGTGLGLWIVKGIVDNHSGRILFRSTVGKGTVFTVLLPISHNLTGSLTSPAAPRSDAG